MKAKALKTLLRVSLAIATSSFAGAAEAAARLAPANNGSNAEKDLMRLAKYKDTMRDGKNGEGQETVRLPTVRAPLPKARKSVSKTAFAPCGAL